FAEITELRVQKPNLAKEELLKRKKRDAIAPDGKLVILAADHPARSVTRVGGNPSAMGHRLDYLGRIVRCLAASHIDGLMATSEKNDRYALETLERVAKAVEECAEVGLPAFVEPLPVLKTETGYKTDLSTDNIIKAVGIASALGYYTGHVWLKIPYCEDFARVAKASTFPILLLGGESTG